MDIIEISLFITFTILKNMKPLPHPIATRLSWFIRRGKKFNLPFSKSSEQSLIRKLLSAKLSANVNYFLFL